MSEVAGSGDSQDSREETETSSSAAWRSTLRTEAVLGVAALTYLVVGFVGADWEADPLSHPLRSLLLFGWIFAPVAWAMSPTIVIDPFRDRRAIVRSAIGERS